MADIEKVDIGGTVYNIRDANAYNKTETDTLLKSKVDTISGKGLSTNDYTTAEKNKLAGIATGAQVNSITGVKGNSETSYRTGNVNLTPANIGAAASSHNHPAGDINSGTLGVARGGTGKATHTANAVLTGNGTNAINNVATSSGALFATAANGAPSFGTLPVAQGGTGQTSLQATRNAMGLGNTTGALPITNGGTGAATAAAAIAALGAGCGIGTTAASVSNITTTTLANGFYFQYNDSGKSNSPDGKIGWIYLHAAYNSSNVIQLAFKYSASSSSSIYYRNCYSGTWNAWALLK